MKVRDLRELPQSIVPPRDLWERIEAAITAAPVDSSPRTRFAWLWHHAAGFAAGLAAAAVAAVAIGLWVDRGVRPLPDPAPVPTAGVKIQPIALDAGYVAQREALMRDLAASLAVLPPDTRAQVEKSLGTLHRSIEELRAALGEDPSNLLLQELLVNAYQNEMRVLVTVQEASRAGQEI